MGNLRVVGVAVALIGLIACSSSTDGAGSGCADISGNYKSTTVETVSNSCQTSSEGDGEATLTFAKGSAANEYSVVIPGVAEGGCPGTLDTSTCRFTSQCKVVNTATGETAVTIAIDFTFSAGGYNGSTIFTAFPPVVSASCSTTAKESGSKI